MAPYAKGANRERKVVELLRSRGYFAVRVAGSHGPADVIALRAGEEPMLVQVKTSPGGALAGSSPAERDALYEAAEGAGGRAVLLSWPPYKQPRWVFIDSTS